MCPFKTELRVTAVTDYEICVAREETKSCSINDVKIFVTFQVVRGPDDSYPRVLGLPEELSEVQKAKRSVLEYVRSLHSFQPT